MTNKTDVNTYSANDVFTNMKISVAIVAGSVGVIKAGAVITVVAP